MMLRTLLWVSLLAVAGVAAAFDPREGTEVLLVDPEGQSILGFGRIRDGGLALQLSPSTGAFTLMMVQADGSVDVFGGRREGIERLDILVPGMGLRTLGSLLSDAGFALDVTLLPALGGTPSPGGLPSSDPQATPPRDDGPPGDDGDDDGGGDDDDDDDDAGSDDGDDEDDDPEDDVDEDDDEEDDDG